MSDLVKRLREDAWLSRETHAGYEIKRAELAEEAADAITALEARIAELESEVIALREREARCAECDCENGGTDCTWIASGEEVET